MPSFRVSEAASRRLDEIYRFTRERWGAKQAERYIVGLFVVFGRIGTHGVVSRPIPGELGVDGYFCRYRKHFIHWRWLRDGHIGIVTVLHERMHRIERFREDS